jgi:Uma2 family endonuclease
MVGACAADTFVEEDDDYVTDNPVPIVEVLSKSSARIDRIEKPREYENLPNLRECLIISRYQVQADIYQRQEAVEDWTKQTYSDLQSQIRFDSIGVEISLADIYKRVRFSENISEMEREE